MSKIEGLLIRVDKETKEYPFLFSKNKKLGKFSSFSAFLIIQFRASKGLKFGMTCVCKP